MNIRTITSTPKAVSFGSDEEIKTQIVRREVPTRTTHARLNQILGLEANQVHLVEDSRPRFEGYTTIYFDGTNKSKINNVLMPNDDLNHSLIINYNDKHPSKKPKGVSIHATSRKFTIYPGDLAQKGIRPKVEKVLQHLRKLISGKNIFNNV